MPSRKMYGGLQLTAPVPDAAGFVAGTSGGARFPGDDTVFVAALGAVDAAPNGSRAGTTALAEAAVDPWLVGREASTCTVTSAADPGTVREGNLVARTPTAMRTVATAAVARK